MTIDEHFLARLTDEKACLVTLHAVRGSVPREPGAWMAVFAHGSIGTVGGGRLEFEAITQARQWLLAQSQGKTLRKYALGPALGQCCGGEAELGFECVGAADIGSLRQRLQSVRHPVALFGAGHVGQALVRVLVGLPFRVHWIDSREQIFPDDLPAGVEAEFSDPVSAAVVDLLPQSRVLAMSFSHAEDLQVIAACLQRQRQQQDLPFVGLIGSASKWASFRRQLLARGFTAAELAHITCPIGVPGIAGKQPAVIAVAVAAQLLQVLPAGVATR